ncbi:prepilin peptidase [Marinobacterium nitratireducens]|uniref:prepilin peptidase n=1 Tax=Marinobacterium nitratireducens TaxID=518897 RepID=UPI002279FAED|nr:prepilin peptidase [Marinobacterium nitratireducens]
MIFIAFFGVLLLIAVFDYKHQRIPNLAVAGLVLISLLSLIIRGVSPAGEVLAAPDVVRSIFLVLVITLPGYCRCELGAGDMKLLLALCIVFLPVQMLIIIAGSFLSTFIFGKIAKVEKVPYAPFLMICSIIMVAGDKGW